jgi:hypothetical protein
MQPFIQLQVGRGSALSEATAEGRIDLAIRQSVGLRVCCYRHRLAPGGGVYPHQLTSSPA